MTVDHQNYARRAIRYHLSADELTREVAERDAERDMETYLGFADDTFRRRNRDSETERHVDDSDVDSSRTKSLRTGAQPAEPVVPPDVWRGGY